MSTTIIKPFNIIGLSVRTTNENAQSAKDIAALWNKFLSENLISKILNKITDDIYCVYTEYEKDHTKPYTTILGCKVENLNSIPEGMTGKVIDGGIYKNFTAKGKVAEGFVFKAWEKIWEADISRTYTSDFEIYGKKAQNPDNAEIDILVGVN